MIGKVKVTSKGSTVVKVLPELTGLPLNEITEAYFSTCRPSTVRLIRNGEVKTDARVWRLTVYLDSKDVIQEIEQEVEIDLPEGTTCGWEVEQARRLIQKGELNWQDKISKVSKNGMYCVVNFPDRITNDEPV